MLYNTEGEAQILKISPCKCYNWKANHRGGGPRKVRRNKKKTMWGTNSKKMRGREGS